MRKNNQNKVFNELISFFENYLFKITKMEAPIGLEPTTLALWGPHTNHLYNRADMRTWDKANYIINGKYVYLKII